MRFLKWPLLIVVLVLALVAVAAASSAADWEIVDYQTRSSQTLDISGNVYVRSNGWLDLTNVDLIMNCTSDGQYTIKVEANGKLTVDGGSIRAYNSSYRYRVELYDDTTIEGATITDTWGQGQAFDVSSGNEPPLAGLKGGIQIYSDDVYIGNSTLGQGALCMVYVKDSSPTLYGNTIHNVSYDERLYSQTPTNPSSTHWSSQAFGVLLDNSPAHLESNEFYDVGVFATMGDAYYSGTARSDNHYHTIAAAVGLRNTRIDMESNKISETGILDRLNNPPFQDGGNTVNQALSIYRVAGVYAYQCVGATMKFNDIRKSDYGLYVVVSTSAAGGAMTFDVIIGNTMTKNDKGGAYFRLTSVSRAVNINVEQDNLNANGKSPTTGLEDCGLVVAATSCTGDLSVTIDGSVLSSNMARGAMIDAHNHDAKLTVNAVGNTVQANHGAGLSIIADTISGDVTMLVDNSTYSNNQPRTTGDSGAIGLEGGDISGNLDVKLADVTVSGSTGVGLGIYLGETPYSANRAINTKYTLHNCQFSQNSEHGFYLMDNYGANAQRAKYEWKGVHSNNNRQAVAVYSNSGLGNVDFQVDGLNAADTDVSQVAVRIQVSAASYNPRSILRHVRVTYTGGSAPGATGLVLQGKDASNRWNVDLVSAYIVQPNTALSATYCNVEARSSNLTGLAENTILAFDSSVNLKYCSVPELSARVDGNSVTQGVFFYKWFNITKVSWQNDEPIKNATIVVKRRHIPRDEVVTASTDATGKLEHKMVPYWVKDADDTPLRNDVLEAFTTIRGTILSSLWFDFNVTEIGIADPLIPELIINSPASETVQKSGTLVIQGEIQDDHSGVRAVEVSLDNIIWTPAYIHPSRFGKDRAPFKVTITNLTDGVYTIHIRGWDVARYHIENLTYAHEAIEEVKIDTTPPALDMLQPQEPFEVTNNATYTLVGQTERSINIRRLTINNTLVPVSGFTFSLVVTLQEGSNFFVIIAEDKAGNVAITTREIVKDTVLPTLVVTSPSAYFSSKEQEFEVSGDTEETADVTIKLDDGFEVPAERKEGTRFYHALTIRVEGLHKITVTSRDLAKNVAKVEVWVKYDKTPPVLEDIVPSTDPGTSTNNQRVYVAGRTDSEVEQVIVNGLYFAVHHGDFALEINLLEGQRTLKIEVYDPAGNYNTTSRSILVDVTPPVLLDLLVSSSATSAEVDTWELEDGLTINERSVRFTGRLLEGDYREVWIQVGSDNRTAIIDDPDAWTFYRDFNLDEGTNIVSFYAIDIPGNRMRQIFKLNVDPRAPLITYHNPKLTTALETTVYEATVVVSGKVEDVSPVTMMINNRQVVVRPDTGTFQTTVPLDKGLNNIEVEVTDRAGNTATDILHITYGDEDTGEASIGEILASVWWVFAIIIGLLVLVPITVQLTRRKWEEEHPELRSYDSKMDREGLYEYEDYGYDDRHGGGGYR